MYSVAIRTDGGASIGMGHIMRCLSLAKAFKGAGYAVLFISKYKEGIDRIRSEGFQVIQLSHSSNQIDTGFYYGDKLELEKEIKAIIEVLSSAEIELLLIDTYNVTEEYFLNVKPYVKKLGYIDDVNKFVYPVDILINGNITGEYMGYKKYSQEEVMLLGPKYNLIRDEFRNIPERNIGEKVKEITLTTGGSDPYNMSVKILNILMKHEELRKLKINVIVGNGFKDKEQLKRISENNKNIVIYENVEFMSHIMLRSDIAISAGGSTLYELCACGTPTLAIIMADNQEFLVKKMDELGYIKSLGWYNKINDDNLIENLKELCFNYNKRFAQSRKMQKLVDGLGAERVVNEVLARLK
jgi:UDP-2,4-diacetamido-2,4,6-trideoxy-beta-L-altropyranose hydrolase